MLQGEQKVQPKSGNRVCADFLQVLEWNMKAWKEVKSETILKKLEQCAMGADPGPEIPVDFDPELDIGGDESDLDDDERRKKKKKKKSRKKKIIVLKSKCPKRFAELAAAKLEKELEPYRRACERLEAKWAREEKAAREKAAKQKAREEKKRKAEKEKAAKQKAREEKRRKAAQEKAEKAKKRKRKSAPKPRKRRRKNWAHHCRSTTMLTTTTKQVFVNTTNELSSARGALLSSNHVNLKRKVSRYQSWAGKQNPL